MEISQSQDKVFKKKEEKKEERGEENNTFHLPFQVDRTLIQAKRSGENPHGIL